MERAKNYMEKNKEKLDKNIVNNLNYILEVLDEYFKNNKEIASTEKNEKKNDNKN